MYIFIKESVQKLLSLLLNHFKNKVEKKEQYEMKEKEHYNKSDAVTLKEIKKLLYESGVLETLKDHDFSGPYNLRFVDPIHKYMHEIDHNPEFNFFNSELDKLKEQLDFNIKNFIDLLITNSFPLDGKSNLVGVPKEWRYEQPKRYKKAVDAINCYSTEINKIYAELVQMARKKQINF